MKKQRHKNRSGRQAAGFPKFRYIGTGDGRILFIKDNKALFGPGPLFDHGPVYCDRDEARSLCECLNGLKPSDIKPIGLPMANIFMIAARENELKEKAKYDLAKLRRERLERESVALQSLIISGPAEPGNAKGNQENDTINKNSDRTGRERDTKTNRDETESKTNAETQNEDGPGGFEGVKGRDWTFTRRRRGDQQPPE